MSERSLSLRLIERVKQHPAETAWCALGAAALAYEMVAPKDQLLSHGADRHPIIATTLTLALGLHLTNAWEKLGLERFDIISQLGKRADQLGLLRGSS